MNRSSVVCHNKTLNNIENAFKILDKVNGLSLIAV